jgi:hypothetical protein
MRQVSNPAVAELALFHIAATSNAGADRHTGRNVLITVLRKVVSTLERGVPYLAIPNDFESRIFAGVFEFNDFVSAKYSCYGNGKYAAPIELWVEPLRGNQVRPVFARNVAFFRGFPSIVTDGYVRLTCGSYFGHRCAEINHFYVQPERLCFRKFLVKKSPRKHIRGVRSRLSAE